MVFAALMIVGLLIALRVKDDHARKAEDACLRWQKRRAQLQGDVQAEVGRLSDRVQERDRALGERASAAAAAVRRLARGSF